MHLTITLGFESIENPKRCWAETEREPRQCSGRGGACCGLVEAVVGARWNSGPAAVVQRIAHGELGRRTDLTEDLKRFGIPTLIAHGDDDQIVPIAAAANKSSKLVKGATLRVYPGAPHGLSMVAACKDEFNADLMAFARG